MPSIVDIRLDLRLRTLRYLFLDRSLILSILLLLTSSSSKCKGVYLTSKIEVS